MTTSYTPTAPARRRVADYVRKAMDHPGSLFKFAAEQVEHLPPEVMQGLLDGTRWPEPEEREAIEKACHWREGDLEWVARGGEPSGWGRSSAERRWRVRVVVEREVVAPTNTAALAEVSEPVREALGGGDIGIVECSAKNMALIRREEREAEDRARR